MEKERTIPEILAEAAVNAIREIAAKGEPLSVTGISQILSGNPDIKKMIEDQDTGAKPEAEASGSVKEADSLKSEVMRLQDQKMDLLRHLTEAEESVSEQGKAYRRFLQFLVDILKNSPGISFQKELEGFRTVLRLDEDFGAVEKSFSVLKDTYFKNSGPGEDHKEKIGLLDRWLKKGALKEKLPHAGEMELYKDAYRDLLNDMRLSLGSDYLERFKTVSRNLERAVCYEDFNSVRIDTISIIRDYITSISREREDAASFIREIGTRLIEIENHFMGTFSEVEKSHDDNKTFSLSLQNHIADISTGLDSCKTLEELKTVVASKLSVIKEAIRNKTLTDDQVRHESEIRMSSLRSGLDQMRHEIEEANTKAQILEMELLRDSLTGAFNRRAYERRINDEFMRFKRYKSPYSVLVFDVDHFKSINDKFGHMVGDRCLQEIIKRVNPVLRDSDIVARYGGEEFVVILPETPLNGALEAAEKIRRTVEATEFIHKDEKVVITVSVGASMVDEGDGEPSDGFNRADEAMYVAKKSGRNRIASK